MVRFGQRVVGQQWEAAKVLEPRSVLGPLVILVRREPSFLRLYVLPYVLAPVVGFFIALFLRDWLHLIGLLAK